MKQKQRPGRETRQKMAFSAILGAALLFLGVVLLINLKSHWASGDVFAVIISSMGALLFFAVGGVLLSDLVRHRAEAKKGAASQEKKEETQEE